MKKICLFQAATIVLIAMLTSTVNANTAPSQNENISQVLDLMKKNNNPLTSTLADRFEKELASGNLVISFEHEDFTDGSDTCGTIGFLGSEKPTLFLNQKDSACRDQLAATAVHEYEHIRILRDEVFERFIAVRSQGGTPTASDVDAKALEYIQGMQLLLNAKKPGFVVTAENARKIMANLLFRVYTETRAYLSTRIHSGDIITDAWTDQQIINTLHHRYLEDKLPYQMVESAVQSAKGSVNYDDYLEKTLHFRSSSVAVSAVTAFLAGERP